MLSATEESLWRATMRIVTLLPRHFDADLMRGAGLTASEYATLASLFEARDHELRMTDLAHATGLSPSHTTRLVDDLQGRRLARKLAGSGDARSTRARITSQGMAKLTSARQTHFESVRNRLISHLDSSAVSQLAESLSTLASRIDSNSRKRTVVRTSAWPDPPTIASKSKLP
jgi:DNA-binding MarR family transcriptional regulator